MIRVICGPHPAGKLKLVPFDYRANCDSQLTYKPPLANIKNGRAPLLDFVCVHIIRSLLAGIEKVFFQQYPPKFAINLSLFQTHIFYLLYPITIN